MPRLVVTDGRTTLATHELTAERTVIGRSTDADVPLDDLTVSRRHAEIRCTGASYLVANLAGRNGVFVNGRWVDQHPLRHGDVLDIGRYRLRFERTEAEQRDAARAAGRAFALSADQVRRAVGARDDPDDVAVLWERQRQGGGGARSRLDSQQETFALQPYELERTRRRLADRHRAQLRIHVPGGLRTLVLDAEVTRIGRGADCAVRLDGGGLLAARVAAEIVARDGRYHVRSVGGRVTVDGEIVRGERRLTDHAMVDVDGLRFEFLDQVDV